MENSRNVKITEEERNKLEKLHFMVESRMNLIARLSTGAVNTSNADKALDRAYEEYDKVYPEYCAYKDALSNKYTPTDEEFKYWEANFEAGELRFHN